MRIDAASPAASPATSSFATDVAALERDLAGLEQLFADAFQAVAGNTGVVSKPPPPKPAPAGLTVKGDTVVTPGGFTIHSDGQYDWMIEDPQGHCTHTSGDPHVAVDQKHVFDFKREAVFELPDGTNVVCHVKPLGNGMTVTTSLDVIASGQQVTIGGIDGGKGRPGQVVAARGGNVPAGDDVFEYGDENGHAGWSLGTGGEITGDTQGGEILDTNGHHLAYAPAEGEHVDGCGNEPPPAKPPPPANPPEGGPRPLPTVRATATADDGSSSNDAISRALLALQDLRNLLARLFARA